MNCISALLIIELHGLSLVLTCELSSWAKASTVHCNAFLARNIVRASRGLTKIDQIIITAALSVHNTHLSLYATSVVYFEVIVELTTSCQGPCFTFVCNVFYNRRSTQ